MTKLALLPRLRVSLMLLLTGIGGLSVHAQYRLQVRIVDKDSAMLPSLIRIPPAFKSQAACITYVQGLPGLLQSKGFIAASVDEVVYDSLEARADVFLGEQFRWIRLAVDSNDRDMLDQAGLDFRPLGGQVVDLGRLPSLREQLLQKLEDSGYPFARVRFDAFQWEGEGVSAKLLIEKGPLYKIDSIHVEGTARISNRYLQRYLGIPNGSLYRSTVLALVSRRIEESAFLREQQPWNLNQLGTGSVLNVFLEPKKSSQVNVLIGLLPATDAAASIYEQPRNKFQLTGEANVNLRNALGSGETIGLNWQQLQLQSPRLNLLFEQPYLFGSPFGMKFAFDLFKKDTSFVNINFFMGAAYAIRPNSSGTVFLQHMQSSMITVDTAAIKVSRQLPREADLRSLSLGVNLEGYTTDYRFNPVSGNEWQLSLSAGTKTIRRNTAILQLKDVNDPGFDFARLYDTVKLNTYQFRLRFSGAHFFRLTRVSAIKAALNLGWLQSPVIFRNELFQIGGYRLLRGFDEESIYASRYAVVTAEYRYLIGRNSHLFSFFDKGWSRNDAGNLKLPQSYWGAGLGLALETKGGIINISFASGKRNDQPFNIRQSKIHIGYINFF